MFHNVRSIYVGFCGVILLFLLSCSGGGSGNPLLPSIDGGSNPPDLTSDTGLTDPSASGGPAAQADPGANTGLWGLYDIYWDNGEIVVTPVRSGALTLNVLDFLQPPNGNLDLLSISIIGSESNISEGLVALDVSITHPISNPRFRGFDTMGVLIGNGDVQFDEDTTAIFSGPDDLKLVNFDGYTRWMNPVEFTSPGAAGYTEGYLGTKGVEWSATVNPFKFFARNLNATDDVTSYLENNAVFRGVFEPDSTLTRRYILQFPMVGGFPQLRFQYAILSHWKMAKDGNGVPIPDPVINDFPPDANCLEAVHVQADPSGSTLYYDTSTAEAGGDLIIHLNIFDWQGYLGAGEVFDEVGNITLGSPDGLFGGNPPILTPLDLAGFNPENGTNNTQFDLVIEGLQPQAPGRADVIIAVYSADPTTYGPLGNFPTAKLAAYTRVEVNILDKAPPEEPFPPEIEEINGPEEVTCWTGSVPYICVATDPNPDDVLTYQWDIVQVDAHPTYPNPADESNELILDMSSDEEFPVGAYALYCRVSDGMFDTELPQTINKLTGTAKAGPIDADPDDINDVTCDNIDAVYTATVETCYGGVGQYQYRFLRGTGTPPDKPNPNDSGWSNPSLENSILYSWAFTEVTDWWIIAEISVGLGQVADSEPLIVHRIDSIAGGLEPPIGATQVDCNSTTELYVLTGGEDCDDSAVSRYWTVTQSSNPPTAGWVPAPSDQFIVDWSVFPEGTYYAWHRIGDEDPYAVSDPLEITRVNTGPDMPPPPAGKPSVNCTNNNELYQAGVVGDCENDDLTRQYAAGTDQLIPPTDGWIDFTGTSFNVDWSQYGTGILYLYQRASDIGGEWNTSTSLEIIKIGASPETPQIPDGPTDVNCFSQSEYQAGPANDCDEGDTITRGWSVTEFPFPPAEWNEFTGDSFFVDWSGEPSGALFLYQVVSDGENLSVSDPLGVLKGNSPPIVETPVGPTSVDCAELIKEYTAGAVSDCDGATEFQVGYYLSTDPDIPTGGNWVPILGSTFQIDYKTVLPGDYYLFQRASDGEEIGISDSLHVSYANTLPAKPGVPDGPDTVDCINLHVSYTGGPITDCDPAQFLERAYYLSTDEFTPAGGEWVTVVFDPFVVDFSGVIPGPTYYLFQRASDGIGSTVSDSFAVTYINSAPSSPSVPFGKTGVSCVDDNSSYSAGIAEDCDMGQNLTRSWGVNTLDWPPAVGWTSFSGDTFNVDWSQYSQGTYFLFQRVGDGIEFSYSTSLQVSIGDPVLITPPTITGPATVDCTDGITQFNAGSYLAGCPDIEIVREWAYATVPTPPVSGWAVFAGTTIEIEVSLLPVGSVYLYQRATLDAQQQVSEAYFLQVLPGTLSTPSTPAGENSIDCTTSIESYAMGTVTAECAGTEIIREYQVQDGLGSPQMQWTEFSGTSVDIDWSTFSALDSFLLVQRADDGTHLETSAPLAIDYVNDVPSFSGPLTGPDNVTCADFNAQYSTGTVDDCDSSQNLTIEWAYNTIDAFPVSGWSPVFGGIFLIDWSSGDFEPGQTYFLFQRVSDGVTTVYDPNSLEVVYTNTPPQTPETPAGPNLILCPLFLQNYDAGDVEDCDGTSLTREWAINDSSSAPTDGWTSFAGTSFQVDWEDTYIGTAYVFQRVSDGFATSTSAPLLVTIFNSNPSIMSVSCDEGNQDYVSDGVTSGLTGLSIVTSLNFTTDITDCEGDTLTNYYAVTDSQTAPSQGDGAWIVFADGTFMLNLATYAGLAPERLYVHVGADDGTDFVTSTWGHHVDMWQKVWLTEFSSSGDMWAEDACVAGVGTYSWSYDSGNDYLRLDSYAASSQSSVWSDYVAMPAAPSGSDQGAVVAYINPGISTSFDAVNFALLDDSNCGVTSLDIIPGIGCGTDSPSVISSGISGASNVWSKNMKVGLSLSGLTGCGSSDLYIGWTGLWIKPTD
ncbi:MAG TPA: hypothetical protein VGB30_01610 [bacterium]